MAFAIQLIKGLMFGIEYHEDDQALYIVLDIGFLRFLFIKGEVLED